MISCCMWIYVRAFSGLAHHDFSGLRNSEVLLPVRLAGLIIPVSTLQWAGWARRACSQVCPPAGLPSCSMCQVRPSHHVGLELVRALARWWASKEEDKVGSRVGRGTDCSSHVSLLKARDRANGNTRREERGPTHGREGLRVLRER